MKLVTESYEQFLNESKRKATVNKKQKYDDLLIYYKDMVKELGIRPVDGLYECHEWVEAVMKSGKTGDNVTFFLFDERKESVYYKEAERLDKKFKNIFMKLGPGVWPYFDYVLGHSFIKHDDIFIDLSLDAEGLGFKDIQKVCNTISELNIFR